MFKDGDGAVLGKHRIVVLPPPIVLRPSEPIPKPNAHKHHAAYDTSELNADIAAGPNEITLIVQKP